MQERTGENSPSTKEGSPTWLAVAAVASLGVILLIAILSVSRVEASNDSEEPVAPTSETDVPEKLEGAPPLQPAEKPDDGWRALLYGSECPAPCSAGSLCATTEDNTFESKYCKGGNDRCIRCASEIKCVPGEADQELAPGERWELHFSAVQRQLPKRSNSWGASDHCDKSHEYWVCLGTADSTTPLQCFGPHDTCSKTETSRDSFGVLTEDMVGRGLRVEIRRDSEDGIPVISKRRAGIHDGMQRRGLCNGFVMRLGEAEGANWAFTFLLEPGD